MSDSNTEDNTKYNYEQEKCIIIHKQINSCLDVMQVHQTKIQICLKLCENFDVEYSNLVSNIGSVDKKLKNLNEKHVNVILKHLNNSHLWNYDIFELDSMCNGNTLRFISGYLLSTFDIFNIFKIPLIVFDNFINKIQEGYSKHNNPYHNSIHASDVTQTVYSIITYYSNYSIHLSSIDIFALIFSAIIHDHEHTGTNNAFHVSTRSDLAILYNDVSVLENHHIASAFKILQDKDCNILSNMTDEQYRKFRSLTITLVLATDMAFHFQYIKNITEMVESKDEITTVKALSMILHAADISNPAKIWKYHSKWSIMLTKEFFNQGEKEKELNIPISPLCNEFRCNIAKSQIGFVTNIVKPCFELLDKMLKKILQQYYVEVAISKSNSLIDFKEDVNEGLNTEIWLECCNSNILDWNKIVEKDENEQN
ncbi:cAMP-specific 3',5'-cyclic phosphodiesterase 7B [Intoshia linei]|uniref:cAMP-specific 3',5'-cyclic phosphodiesterase 7B n=1 Tax=Intoshia linei TaxID=1819745 RepID=A0A177B7W4_9BILA|nr:cAMP-specific 3',5'-cyclic phosphodiesterase 7B [Intoshia linei]